MARPLRARWRQEQQLAADATGLGARAGAACVCGAVRQATGGRTGRATHRAQIPEDDVPFGLESLPYPRLKWEGPQQIPPNRVVQSLGSTSEWHALDRVCLAHRLRVSMLGEGTIVQAEMGITSTPLAASPDQVSMRNLAKKSMSCVQTTIIWPMRNRVR
jgi:hypothetical protein